MDIIELARQAGLEVLLDARIGSVTYHSVSGSLPALQRFADAVEAATRERVPRPSDPTVRRHVRQHAAAMRLRKRMLNDRDLRERGAEKTSVGRVDSTPHRSSR